MSKHLQSTMIYQLRWDDLPSRTAAKSNQAKIAVRSWRLAPSQFTRTTRNLGKKIPKPCQAEGRKDVSDQMSQDANCEIPLPLLGDSKGLWTSTFSNNFQDLISFGDLFGCSPFTKAPFHVMSLLEIFLDSARP